MRSGVRAGGGLVLLVAGLLLVAGGRLEPALAQGAADSEAAANELGARLDPDGYAVVRPVCTRCHGAATFLHARPWPDWQRTLGRMYGNGAVATQDQWDRIGAYFRKNLTLLYVNSAGEDELTAVLGIDEKTAIAIVQRRIDRKFQSAEDLESVVGVDKAAVESMQSRLRFEAPF